MKKISVIIVTYQKIDIVRDCLNSIEKYNDIGDELEVIVSDNSEDNVLFETISKEYPWVKTIKNKNEGFGAGNNRGYEISSGEYLLFLNPDTILVEPIFKFTIEQFEKDKNLALFGVQLIDKKLKRNSSFFIMDGYGIIAAICGKVSRLFGRYVDGKMFIAGADLFVRRTSFEQAGLFDESIFMYKEEADLIKRIKLYSNAKVTRFYNDKKIIHLEGGTESDSRQSVSQIKRLYEADKYYVTKWGGDIKHIYKSRRRQARLKLIVCSIFNRDNIEHVKNNISYYSKIIKED